jgi:hypothetical protein
MGSARRDKKCIQLSVRKPEGKRALGRPRHRQDSIKMYLKTKV